jgi:hypothetical protein
MWFNGLLQSETLYVSITPITRPSADTTTAGWTSTAATLYETIDEVVASDIDFITSPSLSAPTPAVLQLSQSLVAGTYNIRIRSKNTNSGGSFQLKLLDADDIVVGTSNLQSTTNTFTTYTIAITSIGTATKLRIEVTP